MNNKEKQQYLSNMMIFPSSSFLCELSQKESFYSKMPKVLFKYRSFDRYTNETLSEPYVFLSPVNKLDDPFDCLTDSGISEKLHNSDASIGLSLTPFIVKEVCRIGKIKTNRQEMERLIRSCYVDGKFSGTKAHLVIDNSTLLNDEEKHFLYNILLNLDDFTQQIANDHTTESMAKTSLNPGESVGVFCMSEKRDNKVMWSLYSKKYKGYCVEYEMPSDDDIRLNLCPVIYKKNEDNNFIHRIIRFSLANMIRYLSEGQINNEIGCFNELFCTKDSDWKYQYEWRIIGKPGKLSKRLKIKAVYLGFDVLDSNIERIKRIGKKQGFKVFLMNKPAGRKSIRYKQIL